MCCTLCTTQPNPINYVGCSIFDDDDASSTDETSVRPEHTWNEHALPITSIFCGVGGVRGRILTTSNDQTCKVRCR